MDVPLILWHIYGYAVPLVILAVLYGFRWKVGMWGNCLSLGAVLFSFLIAVGWWEDVAYLLAKQFPITLFVADCVAFWMIFVVALLILDTATRLMSTIKVKYADQVENIGNGAVLFLLFLALYGIFLFADDLGTVGEHHHAELKGDSIAIQALRILSAGNLSAFTEARQFDVTGNFRKLHLQRRQAIMLGMFGEEGIQGTDAQVDKIKRKEQ
jgi:signal transduction histidine kinase